MASSAALPGDSFTQAFISERPKLTTTVLQARLKRSDLIASSLSTYFRERAAIEADYSKRLSKLHAKGHIVPDSYGLQHDSGFDVLLKCLEHELEKQIRLHDNFGSRLDSTVASALKDTARSGEENYKNHESAAMSIASRYEEASNKLQKAQGGKATFRKGGDVNKLQSDVDEMHDSWTMTAPAYLNAAQKVEAGRLEEIQQNLAKYETLCSDLAREKMELSEQSLLKILGWDISADLQTFLLKEGSANAAPVVAPVTPRRTSVARPETPANESVSVSRRNSVMGGGAARESTPSVRSGHSSHHHAEKKGLFSGFKSKKMKSFTPGGSEKSAAQNGRGRSHSSAADSYGPIDETEPVPPISSSVRAPHTSDPAASNTSINDDSERYALAPALQPDAFSPQERGFQGSGSFSANRSASKRESKIPSFFQRKSSSHALGTSNSSSGVPQRQHSGADNQLLAADPTSFASDSEPNSPATFGGTQPQAPSMDPQMAHNATLPPASPGAIPSPSIKSSHFTASKTNGLAGMMAPKQSSQPQVDSEGYSIPPPNHDAQPWDAAGTGNNASLMDDDEASQPPSLPKLDIQPEIAPRESEAERQAALQRVQSTLQSSGPGVGRRQTLNRGRRSQAHSMLYSPTTEPMAEEATSSPAPTAATLSSTVPATISSRREPPPVPPSRQTSSAVMASPVELSSPGSPNILAQSTSTEPPIGSPTASVDGHAIGHAANPFENPSGSGLRASITETLSVLSRSGQPPRAQVVGEVSLQLKELSDTVEHFTLRLQSAEAMEKLAPNNQIVSPAGAGLFKVQAKALQQACQSSTGPVVVLRYHVALSAEQTAALPPLRINSQWKCEPTLTSLIVTYAPDVSSILATAPSASPFNETPTLKDFSLAVPITSDGVAQVQSKPAGMYHAERKRLLWRLDDMPLLSSDTGERKVLARFQVAEQSKPQPIAVKWTLPGRLVSPISLELADASASLDRIEELNLRTVSGKYLCQ